MFPTPADNGDPAPLSQDELCTPQQINNNNNNDDDDDERVPESGNVLAADLNSSAAPSSSTSLLTNYDINSKSTKTNEQQRENESQLASPAARARDDPEENGCGESGSDRDTQTTTCVVEEVADKSTDSPQTATNTTAPFHDHTSPTPAADNRAGLSEFQTEKSVEGSLSHIIPGVEHVFFEEELDKMEQTSNQHKNIIVLAADGTTHSERAFKFYKDNVDRPGYYLHVVHHSDVWGSYAPGEEGPSVDHCKELVEKAKGAVDEVSQKYKKLMEEHSIEGETVVLHGKDAWHDIIQHQERTNAMMIVMGTRGHGAISRTFRGSVSDSVVHHANVPVLVCCHPKDHH